MNKRAESPAAALVAGGDTLPEGRMMTRLEGEGFSSFFSRGAGEAVLMVSGGGVKFLFDF